MKRCTKCDEEKPLEDFYVDRRSKAGRTPDCKFCRSAATSGYYARNRNKVLQRQKKWDERNPEKRREYSRRWQENNREQYLAAQKAYREANKERIAAAWKAYYEANRETLNAKVRAWNAANPDKKQAARDPARSREYTRKRRALKAQVESDGHTRREIFERDDGICVNCEVVLDLDDSSSWEIDHIVPLSLGGPDTRANVQLMCRGCNRKKNARLEGQTHFAA